MYCKTTIHMLHGLKEALMNQFLNTMLGFFSIRSFAGWIHSEIICMSRPGCRNVLYCGCLVHCFWTVGVTRSCSKISNGWYCDMWWVSLKSQKKHFSVVICSHADSFGFVCLSFEISACKTSAATSIQRRWKECRCSKHLFSTKYFQWKVLTANSKLTF